MINGEIWSVAAAFHPQPFWAENRKSGAAADPDDFAASHRDATAFQYPRRHANAPRVNCRWRRTARRTKLRSRSPGSTITIRTE
jgi:hypothetical protein